MLPTFFINQAFQKEALPLIEYDNAFKKRSLFECIANELIEQYKNDNSGNAKVLKTLLTYYANYFPKQLPFHIARLDTKDQIDYLLTYALPHDNLLVPSIAYSLQQMTIDMICKYPEQYGNLLQAGASIHELREMKTLDHPSILQALADHVLMSSIYLERYQNPNLLPVKEYYLYDNSSPKTLYLHYKDETYLHEHIKNIGIN